MIAVMTVRGHDPIAKFIRWLEDARRTRILNYEAMALATASRNGKTSVRFVLLKGIDERGFVFFTDARSRKGRELRSNPFASLALYPSIMLKNAVNGSQNRFQTRTSSTPSTLFDTSQRCKNCSNGLHAQKPIVWRIPEAGGSTE